MVTCLFECKMTLLHDNTHRTCLTLHIIIRYLSFSRCSSRKTVVILHYCKYDINIEFEINISRHYSSGTTEKNHEKPQEMVPYSRLKLGTSKNSVTLHV